MIIFTWNTGLDKIDNNNINKSIIIYTISKLKIIKIIEIILNDILWKYLKIKEFY